MSQNGRFKATMQFDGNFVLSAGKSLLWETKTAGKGYRVVMQNNGFLVVYDRDGNSLWTSPSRGDYVSVLPDGNLAIVTNSNIVLAWYSNTTQCE